MKRTIVLLATLLLSFGLIQGQVRNIDIDVPMIDDSLRNGVATTLDVSLENDYILGGMSLGFKIFSTEGVEWSWDAQPNGVAPSSKMCVTLVETSRIGDGSVFDMTNVLITEYDVDEAGGQDILMVGGVAMMQGLPAGPMDHLYSYHFTPNNTNGGAPEDAAMLCFDSIFVPPSGAFVFVGTGGDAFPPVTLWPDGGECYPVTGPRNFCPEYDMATYTMGVSHCDVGSVQLGASDFEGKKMGKIVSQNMTGI